MAIAEKERSEGAMRPPATDEPTVRGNMLKAFRSAAVDLWKEEVLAVIGEHLPADVRASTVDALFILSDAVFPERYVLQWLHSVWQGPARREHARLRAFMGRVCELGFVRVRRLLLNMSTPAQLGAKASEIGIRNTHTGS